MYHKHRSESKLKLWALAWGYGEDTQSMFGGGECWTRGLHVKYDFLSVL